jgi:hypothetical protein
MTDVMDACGAVLGDKAMAALSLLPYEGGCADAYVSDQRLH